jgi:uncharacterized protein YbjT (DUF2867 family)
MGLILVTDSTGFVGRNLVSRLATEGRPIRCLLRPSRHVQQLPKSVRFSAVSASLSDPPALRTAMQDVTEVIHLLGEEDPDQQRRIPEHGADTRNLIEAAQEVGIRRIVYVSRLGADRASAYTLFRARGEAEWAVRESGMQATVVRSAISYGRDDAFTNVLALLARATPVFLPVPHAGLSRFQPIWVDDLVRCIVEALDRSDLIGQTIPVGGPDHFTFDQIVTLVLDAAHIQRRLLHVRMPLMGFAMRLANLLLPRNPTPRWWLDLLAAGSATDLTATMRTFSFKPQPFAQSLGYLAEKQHWRRDLLRYVLGHG